MKIKQLKLWKGIVALLVGICSPFGGWATGDVSLRGAIVISGIGFLTSLYTWLDNQLSDIVDRRRLRLEAELTKDECPELEEPKLKSKKGTKV